MIKALVIGVGTIAGVGVLAYATRKWWMPLVLDIKNKKEHNSTQSSLVEKEVIEKLSYEHIIKCVNHIFSDNKNDIPEETNTKLLVMPNKIAQDYYNFSKNQGGSFFINEELTDEEKEKMIVVLVTTSDNSKDIIWGRVFIPNELADDFSDFIPEDKIYTREIDKESSKVKEDSALYYPISSLPVGALGHTLVQSYGVMEPWEMLRKCCESSSWVVNEVFTVTGSLYEYIEDTMDNSSKYEPQAVYISPVGPLLQYIEDQENKELQEDLIEIKNRLQGASQNGEVLLLCKVKDTQGQEYIANPLFVKAEQGFEANIQDTLDKDQIYEKRISIN